jgi:hypothetical protein
MVVNVAGAPRSTPARADASPPPGRTARARAAVRAYLDRVTAGSRPAGPRERPTDPEERSWRRSWKVGAWVWIAGHALLLMATAVTNMPKITDPYAPETKLSQPLRSVLLQWVDWDGGHYRIIATTGYGHPENTTAFYPFYPLVVRFVHLIVPGDVTYSMILVSNVASLVALVLLHRFVTAELGRDLAERTTFYLAAYPFAFFLHVGYTESLFLALAVGSLYCMRRNRWWAAGCLAAFSSATRSTGVLLGAVMLFEYLRQREFRPRRIRLDGLAVLMAPLGVAGFALYCWHKFGNPLQFSIAQRAWGRRFALPWATLWHGVASLGHRPLLYPMHIYNSIDVLFTLAGLVGMVLAVVGPWKLRPDQLFLAVYGWLNLLLILCFPLGGLLTMNSFPRYLLTVIPIFMVLARIGRNRNVERVYLMFALGMQAIWVTMFMNTIWAG